MDADYVPFTGEIGGRQLRLPALNLWEDWRLFVADESRPNYAGPFIASESTIGLTDCRMMLELDRPMIPGGVDMMTGPSDEGLLETLIRPHERVGGFVPLSSVLMHQAADICTHCFGFGALPLMSLSGGGLLDLLPCESRYVCNYFGDPLSIVGDACPQAGMANLPYRIHGAPFAGWYVLRMLMLGGCEVATAIDPAYDGAGILPFRFHGGRGVVRPLKIKEGAAV